MTSGPGIDYFSRGHPLRSLASSISMMVRRKMFDFFMEAMRPGSETIVLDVGVTPDQDLPESNFFEDLYPYKNRLVATSIEDASFLVNKYPGLSFVRTEGAGLPFKDKSFDLVFCSAVLEHAGSRSDQEKFISEILRVGKAFFITTPNRWFPVEFHTLLPVIHWLPGFIHQQLLSLLGMHFWSKTDNLNLLSQTTLRDLFPQSIQPKLKKQRLFTITSNLIVYGKSRGSIARL